MVSCSFAGEVPKPPGHFSGTLTIVASSRPFGRSFRLALLLHYSSREAFFEMHLPGPSIVRTNGVLTQHLGVLRG